MGDSVQLTCYISKGDAPLNITWYHNNQTISPSSGINTILIGARTSLLSITNIEPKHSGNYLCVASNRAGSMKHTATLYINGITVFNVIYLI